VAQLRFAPAAARDIQKISDDIKAAAGKDIALAFVGRLRRSLEGLVAFPGMGRLRRRFGSGVRSWAVPPYVAFYRQSGNDVEIIRIVHGKRRITRALMGGG
jgi:toxin ParE1/3/4